MSSLEKRLSSLSIIIVNWNAGEQLRDCILSIGKANHDGFYLKEVVVIDNSSSDNSLVGIEQLGVNVRVIHNSINKGFGAACNQGVAETTTDYLLFLNPDTLLFEKSLKIPLEFMGRKENVNIGVVGIQLLDDTNAITKSCARFPNLNIFIAQAFGINRLPGFKSLNMHMFDWEHDKTGPVDHVIGAYYLIRRHIFEKLGEFDERYFVYLEDLDLSLRIHKAGLSVVYLADAQAFHAGGGTSKQIKAKRLFYSLQSRLIYSFKHFSKLQAWVILLVTCLIEPFTRLIFSVFGCNWSNAKHTIEAYILLIKNLPTIFKTIRS